MSMAVDRPSGSQVRSGDDDTTGGRGDAIWIFGDDFRKTEERSRPCLFLLSARLSR